VQACRVDAFADRELGGDCATTQIAAMSLRLLLAAFGLAVSACALYDDSEFPESAVPLGPPAEFRTWWQVVEGCSGRQSSFDEVRWFQANDLTIRGEFALGAWFPSGNRIALLGSE
jgi:hypothetical protein